MELKMDLFYVHCPSRFMLQDGCNLSDMHRFIVSTVVSYPTYILDQTEKEKHWLEPMMFNSRPKKQAIKVRNVIKYM